MRLIRFGRKSVRSVPGLPKSRSRTHQSYDATLWVTLSFALCIATVGHASWYSPITATATVLLERQVGDSFHVHGTGILLYDYNNREQSILVTNKHVLARPELHVTLSADSSFAAWCSSAEAKSLIADADTWLIRKGNRLTLRVSTGFPDAPRYTTHPDTAIDLAAIPLRAVVGVLRNGDSVPTSPTKSIPRSLILPRDSLAVGDDVYFIGFPYSYGTEEHISPIVRSGAIASLNPDGRSFLVDAFSFGGNSGGPVFAKPRGSSAGWRSQPGPYLVGMVTGYIYQWSPIAQETAEDSITYLPQRAHMNMGLAMCHWTDDILIVADLATRSTK